MKLVNYAIFLNSSLPSHCQLRMVVSITFFFEKKKKKLRVGLYVLNIKARLRISSNLDNFQGALPCPDTVWCFFYHNLAI